MVTKVIGKRLEHRYSEKDVSTTTNALRAVVRVVERKLEKMLSKGVLLTDQVVESLVDEEWEKIKKRLAYWRDVRQKQQQVVNDYKLSEKVLQLVRSEILPGVKDTLDVSAFGEKSKKQSGN